MPRLLPFAFALLLGLAVAGCDLFSRGPSPGPGDDSDEEVEPVIIDANVEPGEYPDDHYRILRVSGTDTLSADTLSGGGSDASTTVVRLGTVETDTLALRVQYSGGCAEHTFQLVAGRAFMESSPVQAGVQLFHDANGDVCRAQLTETVRFDLAPLKKQYREQYGRGAGVMLLRLAPDEEQRLLVRCAFEA